MGQTKQYIAIRYAQAFLNLYGDKLTHDNYEAFMHIERDLASQKKVLFFFGLTMIPDAVKHQALDRMCAPYPCGSQFRRLLVVLLESQRMYLLPFVLEAIIKGYRELHHVTLATVTTSHMLSEQAREQVRTIFEKKMGTVLVLEYVVAPRLIAGLQVRTEDVIWEYSIDKQLRDIERSLSDKGHA